MRQIHTKMIRLIMDGANPQWCRSVYIDPDGTIFVPVTHDESVRALFDQQPTLQPEQGHHYAPLGWCEKHRIYAAETADSIKTIVKENTK